MRTFFRIRSFCVAECWNKMRKLWVFLAERSRKMCNPAANTQQCRFLCRSDGCALYIYVEGAALTHGSPLKLLYLVVWLFSFSYLKCVYKQAVGDLGELDPGIRGREVNGLHFGEFCRKAGDFVHAEVGNVQRRAGTARDPAAPTLLRVSLLPSAATYPSLNRVCLPDLPRMKCHILD